MQIRTQQKEEEGRGEDGTAVKDTYSTYLFHDGVSDCAMNTQLVKIVHIINILNNVKRQIKENNAFDTRLHNFFYLFTQDVTAQSQFASCFKNYKNLFASALGDK